MKLRIVPGIVLMLLLLFWTSAFGEAAPTVVHCPPLSYTITDRVGIGVARTPGTEIESFTTDDEMVAFNHSANGMIIGNYNGSTTMHLTEFDQFNNIRYCTEVYVKVVSMDWSATLSGLIDTQITYTVGDSCQSTLRAEKDGEELPIKYISSNPAVATVDQNGLIRFVGAGSATVTAVIPGYSSGQTAGFIVRGEWEGAYTGEGTYLPTDPAELLNVYESPDPSSRVLTRVLQYESPQVLTRSATWCKVSANGYIGYVPTNRMTFPDDAPKKRTINAPCTLYVYVSPLWPDYKASLFSEPRLPAQGAPQFEKDTPVTVYGQSTNGWFTVSVNGQTGCMMGKFLSDVPPDGQIAAYAASVSTTVPASGSKATRSAQAGTGSAVRANTAAEPVIRQLGSFTCSVSQSGITQEVPTGNLDIDLAYIFAPNTGRVSLREKPSEQAKLLKKAKAGVIVRVLESGRTFSKIEYKGTTGYVLSRYLKAFDSVDTARPAKLSYNGYVNGGTTINLRNKADRASAKVAEWLTGTDVLILSESDGWYEIEAKGIRGFVQERFITFIQ